MAAQQRRFHWDKRKRRYIQLQPNEKVQAGKRKRTESGKLGQKGDAPSGLYKKWVRSSKLRVPATGELPETDVKYSDSLAERYAQVLWSAAHQFVVLKPETLYCSKLGANRILILLSCWT